jgi:antirestriction protein ArdC
VMKTIPVYQKDEDGEVIKDSKGKPIPVNNKDGSPKIAFKWYAVFNAGQIAGGLDPYIKSERVVKPNEAVEQLAAALMARTGLKITHSERGRAFYSKSSHTVHMPERHLFETEEGYADCLLHELTHSTGPALNRDMTGRFGEESYAFEELVAQLGSVFMAKELGVPYDMSAHENSAAYLKSWLSTLKMDKNFLMRASAQASESVKLQLDHLSKYRAAPTETVPSEPSVVEAEADIVCAMRPAPTRLGM